MSLDATKSYTLDEIKADGEPLFFSSDPLYYKNLLIKEFERLTDRTLYEGQVEMYMIEVMAYALQVRGAELQFAVLQRLLPFAFGRYLDYLASRVHIFRLKAASAAMDVTFTLTAPRPSTIVIPKDTRVRGNAADNIFLTAAVLLIQPGSMTGTVQVIAETSGEIGNGIEPGTELTILDPIASVQSAKAATQSNSGGDEEKDDSLRLRASEAWELVSRGGPREGYRQIALGAHPSIIDVAVVRPQPCDIQIFPLTETMPPGTEILAAIEAACDPVTIRPEGDELFVLVPTAVAVSLNVTVLTDGEPSEIQQQAEAAVKAVFEVWRRQLGIRIATAVIISAVKAIKGVEEVTVSGLSYRDLADNEYAVLTSLSIVVEEA